MYKIIPGYEPYAATEEGHIINTATGHILTEQRLTRRSRTDLRVHLWDKHKRKKVKPYVHRLVAMAWHDNPEGKYSVDHINGNPMDNRPSNLRWATAQEQVDYIHEQRPECRTCGRRVVEIHKDGTRVEYLSANFAAKQHGLFAGSIVHNIKTGQWHRTLDIRWEYI